MNRTVIVQEERIRIALAVEQMLLAFGISPKEAADAGEDCLEDDEFELVDKEPANGSFEDMLKWLHEEQLECR